MEANQMCQKRCVKIKMAPRGSPRKFFLNSFECLIQVHKLKPKYKTVDKIDGIRLSIANLKLRVLILTQAGGYFCPQPAPYNLLLKKTIFSSNSHFHS